jgi:hypothetical protein
MSTYNGWRNWETWIINLYVSDELIALADGEDDVGTLAERFCEYVKKLVETGPNNSLLNDIVGGFMVSVDWRELAKHANENNE